MVAVENAAKNHGVMTTIVGIGVDFDVTLTDRLACVRGANYFTAHSTDEFLHQMTEELDYLMAPLAFDIEVKIDSRHDGHTSAKPVVAEHVYGAPEPANRGPRPEGTLARINSFFPSPTDAQGQTKGSLIVCKLNEAPPSGRLCLSTIYNPRSGGNAQKLHHEAVLRPLSKSYDAAALKSIALVRYVNAVRCYLTDMSDRIHIPSTSKTDGIVHPGSTTCCKQNGKTKSSKCLKMPCKRASCGEEPTEEECQEARQRVATSYCETFDALEQYLKDMEIGLKSLGDQDGCLSKWRNKLVELRTSCAKYVKKPDSEETT